ncbi:hypothetical protein OAV71_01610 [Opitutales bacterium]|nr:hypothetical protein [Opitutales bacterium]
MENKRSAFALKLILGFPLVGIVWTCIICFLSDSRQLNFSIAYWIGGIGISIGVLCLLSKGIFQIVWWLWNKIIFLIDTTITWLTLPLFYFLVFTPFALLLRAIGKADMKHPSKNRPSFWKNTDQPSSAKQYLRQF